MKPWYTVASPRQDLREGKTFDTSEFAVHLEQVRDGIAPKVYQDAHLFFDRTYLTQNLSNLGVEVIRRLSGNTNETSAVFNFITQFGGGKTHALTMLYHLAQSSQSKPLHPNVKNLFAKAGVNSIPQTATAIFVGTEMDATAGRGGNDGTPLRKTPWGDIAYQLGGEEGFALVAKHEEEMIAPAGDIIRQMLPNDRPCIILMDELLSYASRNRKYGLNNQLYHFLHTLSDTVSRLQHVVLAISIPKSLAEMTADDEEDYKRLEHVHNRVSKATLLSAENEIAEIIRRRLFEWDPQQIEPDGRMVLSKEAIQTCNEYANWVYTYRQSLPNWFPVDHAKETFAATYPFHPTVLSVFERKWQGIPRFQRTRGMLRLLALWVAHAYQQGYTGAHSDPLIDLGTAPLEDTTFRGAVFEQLGETRLEIPVTTDICGAKDSHAIRLDSNAVDTIRKNRLHRKVATTIFFESNGGQAKGFANIQEIRLGMAAPNFDIANVETILDALIPPEGACYYLHAEQRRYWFSVKPTITRIFADRKASLPSELIQQRVEEAVKSVFQDKKAPMTPICFPENSGKIPNRPVLTMVVLPPEHAANDQESLDLVEKMTREAGTSGRTFKSALIWILADGGQRLREEARKLLAWQALHDEQSGLRLDDQQYKQVAESIHRSERDLREAVWQSYNSIVLLQKDNKLHTIDLSAAHSSASPSFVQYILNHLRQAGELVDDISPNYLVRNWAPAFVEWSTKDVRDAFFASPIFPRLMNGNTLHETIAKGVNNGFLAYVGKAADGSYEPFYFHPTSGSSRDIPPERQRISSSDVEISESMYIITKATAEAYLEQRRNIRTLNRLTISPSHLTLKPGDQQYFAASGYDQDDEVITLPQVAWSATGGTMTQDGLFTAGNSTGNVTITATIGDIRSTVMVTIEQEIHLARLAIKPANITIQPGKQQRFQVHGYDKHGREIVNQHVVWTATGGTIQQDGVFVAGQDAGDFQVIATDGDIQSTARVTIEQRGAHRMTWRGKITPQQWMNFYSKVASQFSISHKLTFTVQMDVSHQDGLSEDDIESLKTALREFHLNDDVAIE